MSSPSPDSLLHSANLLAKRPVGWKPFKTGDRIVWCGDRFIVLANFGSHGRVKEAAPGGITIEKFYWDFQGEHAVLDAGKKKKPAVVAVTASPDASPLAVKGKSVFFVDEIAASRVSEHADKIKGLRSTVVVRREGN
jgi:hypothetical protein